MQFPCYKNNKIAIFQGDLIMKIKQQNRIKDFLTREYGRGMAVDLFARQESELNKAIENTCDKTKNQMKTLTNTVLPRVALYKALQEKGFTQEQAYECLRKYMIGVVGAKKHGSTARMEIVPGFYFLYSNIFLKIMQITDLQQSRQAKGKDYFDVTITKCLWHTACVENGCGELCRLFCDVDDITYGGLKKMGFTRTKTLGYGGDCCDFHFFKK